MSRKSRASRPDWNECVYCTRIISNRDIDKHAEQCSQNDILASDTVTSYGYIRNGVLFNTVTQITEQLSEKLRKSESTVNKNLVIHTSAMKLLGLKIGQFAVMNKQYGVKVWPSETCQPTTISVTKDVMKSSDMLKENAVVSLAPLICIPTEAEEVLISISQSCSGFVVDDSLKTFIQNKLSGNIVANQNIIRLCYYGQPVEFTVTEIKYKHAIDSEWSIQGKATASSDISVLTESLSELDVSDANVSLDVSETLVVNSTPKRTNCLTSELNASGQSIASPRTPLYSHAAQFITPMPCTSLQYVSTLDLVRFCTISTSTIVNVMNQVTKIDTESSPDNIKITFANIGGLDSQINTIQEIIHLPLQSADILTQYGFSMPKGVLLFGPSGTGKSMIIEGVSNEVNMFVLKVSGSEIWSKYYGETEKRLIEIFRKAKQCSPSIILIDEIDTLCPKRSSATSELEKRVVSCLLTLMDSLNNLMSDKTVLVLAATSRPDALDPALRRPGRFDREIEIGVPTVAERASILSKILAGFNSKLLNSDIASIAEKTHGFVGADLQALCKEATLLAVKRLPQTNTKPNLRLSVDYFTEALKKTQPSALREVQLDVPKVLWSEIGGQSDVKLKLKQAVEWPLKHPDAFIRMGIQPPKGILMYGPPGCSKTMIAKALATESGLNFIAIKGPELFSKWVGDSEKAVREVFRKARSAAPSIIFFDEIDALAVERSAGSGGNNVAERVLAQLLTEIDGVEKLTDVTVVAATNRPDMIDKALMRPGRFDRILYVPLPDAQTRKDIFTIRFKTMPVSCDVIVESLVERTDHFSGAEVVAICHEAAMFSLQEDISNKEINVHHFEQALSAVHPRISSDMISFYESYHKQSGLKHC